jgi:divalent metal cation (Fe/Co/Zn/Cd) transporter
MKFGYEPMKVRSVLLRPTGIVSQAEVHIEVDGSKPLTEVESLSSEIAMEVRSKIPTIARVSVVPHSLRPPPTTPSKAGTPSRKWSGMFSSKK